MSVSRCERWARYGWTAHRPDGQPEDGGIWEPRMTNGSPAACACADWTEAQRLDWVAAQEEEIRALKYVR